MLKRINFILMLFVSAFAFTQNKNNPKIHSETSSQKFKVIIDDQKEDIKCFQIGYMNSQYYLESYETAQCDQCYDWDIKPINSAPINGLTFDIDLATGEELDMTQQVNINPHAIGDYLVTLTYFDEDGCHTCKSIIKILSYGTSNCEYCLNGSRKINLANAHINISNTEDICYSTVRYIDFYSPALFMEPVDPNSNSYSDNFTINNGIFGHIRFAQQSLLDFIDPDIYINLPDNIGQITVTAIITYTDGSTDNFSIQLENTTTWTFASNCTDSNNKFNNTNRKTTLSIFPNPSKNGKITLNFSKEQKDNTPVHIIIKDVLGRVQFKINTKIKDHQVLLNDLNFKGKFFLQATTQEKIYTKILVLE